MVAVLSLTSNPASDEWFGLKDTDMYTQLKKIKEMKPDVVPTSGQTEPSSLIMRQGKEVWPEIKLVMWGALDRT